MKKSLFLLLALALCAVLFTVPATAFASGTSIGGAKSFETEDPFSVIEVMRCEVVFVEDDGTIIVRDREGGAVHPLAQHPKTQLTAQDKKAFGGRKKIDYEDLAVGHDLKVSVRPATGEVVAVKVLKEKKKKKSS